MRQIRTYCILFFMIGLFCVSVGAQAQEPGIPKDNLGAALKDFSQLSDTNKNMILSTVGLPQASDFGVAKIVANLLFGAIGFIAFVYGKKNSFWKPMLIGIVLMGYSYFVSGAVAIYLVGIGLTALLYFWRE